MEAADVAVIIGLDAGEMFGEVLLWAAPGSIWAEGRLSSAKRNYIRAVLYQLRK